MIKLDPIFIGCGLRVSTKDHNQPQPESYSIPKNDFRLRCGPTANLPTTGNPLHSVVHFPSEISRPPLYLFIFFSYSLFFISFNFFFHHHYSPFSSSNVTARRGFGVSLCPAIASSALARETTPEDNAGVQASTKATRDRCSLASFANSNGTKSPLCPPPQRVREIERPAMPHENCTAEPRPPKSPHDSRRYLRYLGLSL